MADPTPTPEVAPQPLLSMDPVARKKRYLELRERLGKPKSTVVGKAGVHYFWAAKDDSSEMARLDAIGYVIVREPNPKEVMAGTKKPVVQAAGLREDGTYVLGDVILTSCPEEVYEFSLMDVEERHSELVKSSTEDFIAEAEKVGAPTFNVNKDK